MEFFIRDAKENNFNPSSAESSAWALGGFLTGVDNSRCQPVPRNIREEVQKLHPQAGASDALTSQEYYLRGSQSSPEKGPCSSSR